MAEKTETAERIIALIAGASGTGKSFWISCLPNALIIDTDIGGGLRYADAMIERNGSARVGPQSKWFDESIGEYTELMEFLRKHNHDLDKYSTLAIDSITVLQDNAVARHNPKFDRDYGRGSDIATREWKRIREICRSKDFNLICTAHLKGKWEKDEQVGMQASGPKELAGDMDVVLFLNRSGEYPSNAQVIKWRRLPDDDRGRVPPVFPFTLDQFCKIDGTDALRRGRQPLEPASPEQVSKLNALLEVAKVEQKIIDKWLKAAAVETFEEMPAKYIEGCISFVQKMLTTAANGQTDTPKTVKKGASK